MTSRRVLAALLLAAAAAAPADAGFRQAEWGMTPEQVAAAVPEAKLDKGSPAETLGGKTIGNVGKVEELGHTFRAVFYYDDRGLNSVALKAVRARECKPVLQALLDAHMSLPRTIACV